MKRLLIGLLVLFSTTARAQKEKEYVIDPNATARTIGGSFSAIQVSGGIDLYLSQSNEEALAVSAAEEKYKENIKTKIEGNTLKIYYEGDRNWNSGRKKLRAYLSYKTLTGINASGACDVYSTGTIDVASLKLELSGACDFRGKVKVGSLDLKLSGASDVRIEGTAGTVNIESSGASDVRGYDLITDVCTAKASGASDINITVNKELSAHASGASDIYYKGTGLVREVHSGGASTVSKKN